MRQVRMCEYSDLLCRHTKTFLHLPSAIRRRIYIYAGLSVQQDLLLGWRDPENPLSWSPPSSCLDNDRDDEDEAYALMLNLLATNPQIHEDVLSALCSENRVVVRHSQVEYGLGFLQRLPPRACSDMRALYVHLFLNTAPENRYGYKATFKPSRSWHSQCSCRWWRRRPGQPTCWRWTHIVTAWQEAISHILAHATRGRLSLYLICDIGLSTTTQEILQPLLDHAGVLKECHIRLGPVRDKETSALAKSVSLRSMGLHRHQEEETPFPFMRLPPELRRYILEFTDLVTPFKEVQWSQSSRYSVRYSPMYPQCDNDDGVYLDLEPWGPHFWSSASCRLKIGQITGCFCHAIHAARSPDCHCWTPPTSLFLVSRALYHEAMDVLYTHNRIILFPTIPIQAAKSSYDLLHPPAPWQSTTRLSASRFLTGHIYPSALSHIRHLELVLPFPLFFPAPQPSSSSSSCPDPSLEDWAFALDHLQRQRLLYNPPVPLTITIHMALGPDVCQKQWNETQVDYYPRVNYPDNLENLLGRHVAVLRPLKDIKGLQDVFVFVDRDWAHWKPTGKWSRRWRERARRSRMDKIETWLEEVVLGGGDDSSGEAESRRRVRALDESGKRRRRSRKRVYWPSQWTLGTREGLDGAIWSRFEQGQEMEFPRYGGGNEGD